MQIHSLKVRFLVLLAVILSAAACKARQNGTPASETASVQSGGSFVGCFFHSEAAAKCMEACGSDYRIDEAATSCSEWQHGCYCTGVSSSDDFLGCRRTMQECLYHSCPDGSCRAGGPDDKRCAGNLTEGEIACYRK